MHQRIVPSVYVFGLRMPCCRRVTGHCTGSSARGDDAYDPPAACIGDPAAASLSAGFLSPALESGCVCAIPVANGRGPRCGIEDPPVQASASMREEGDAPTVSGDNIASADPQNDSPAPESKPSDTGAARSA
jgi:hypothetical protein